MNYRSNIDDYPGMGASNGHRQGPNRIVPLSSLSGGQRRVYEEQEDNIRNQRKEERQRVYESTERQTFASRLEAEISHRLPYIKSTQLLARFLTYKMRKGERTFDVSDLQKPSDPYSSLDPRLILSVGFFMRISHDPDQTLREDDLDSVETYKLQVIKDIYEQNLNEGLALFRGRGEESIQQHVQEWSGQVVSYRSLPDITNNWLNDMRRRPNFGDFIRRLNTVGSRFNTYVSLYDTSSNEEIWKMIALIQKENPNFCSTDRTGAFILDSRQNRVAYGIPNGAMFNAMGYFKRPRPSSTSSQPQSSGGVSSESLNQNTGLRDMLKYGTVLEAYRNIVRTNGNTQDANGVYEGKKVFVNALNQLLANYQIKRYSGDSVPLSININEKNVATFFIAITKLQHTNPSFSDGASSGIADGIPNQRMLQEMKLS